MVKFARKGLWTALFLVLVAPSPGSAFPIAPLGYEALKVIVNGTDPVVAQYLGNSATYSNDLYLMLDAFGNPGDDGIFSNDMFLFNNHASPLNSLATLGSFAVGTELIFRLHVNNTGYDYYTGPGTRNPDGKAHARVQPNYLPSTSLVSFEDLFNTPEFPDGFNDLSFSFTNTTTIVDAPEPPTAFLLAFGLVGIVALRRNKPLW